MDLGSNLFSLKNPVSLRFEMKKGFGTKRKPTILDELNVSDDFFEKDHC